MTPAPLLLAYLTQKLGGLVAAWTGDRLATWWRDTTAETASTATAAEFPEYPELESTLRSWARHSDVLSTLGVFASGAVPRHSEADVLLRTFLEVGFQPVGNGPSGDEVLTCFFKHYDQALLKAEGTQYSTLRTEKTVLGVGTEILKSTEALRSELLKLAGMALPGADTGLLPGEDRSKS